MNTLAHARRPEVKALLQAGPSAWLGAADGLYRWDPGSPDRLQRHPDWAGRKIAALAAATDGGLLLAVAGPQGLEIHVTDVQGHTLRVLPAIDVDEPKSLLAVDDLVFAGGKRGIHRCQGGVWSHVHGQGHTEVIGLQQAGPRIHAYAKKQGPHALPALIVSDDGGLSWRIELETSYHDGILAARDGRYVTSWRGPWSAGEAVSFTKDAANAALLEPDLCGWIAGNKLCLRFERSGSRLDLKDPRFAEAEHLLCIDGRALVAGGNGAWCVDLRAGTVLDLFADHAASPSAAKLKKLWALEDGRLLATASFGSFWSDDEGLSWQRCRSDWDVLDAEGLALSPDGAWYLAAQRGLFVSWNDGEHWKQVKLGTQPHFAELTGVAMAGDRLVLGSKAGLFVSAPGEPKRLQHQAWFGAGTVTGLLVGASGTLWVGAADGRLMRLDPEDAEGALHATFSGACTPLQQRDDSLTVLAGKRLVRCTPGGIEALDPPGAGRGVDAAASPRGELLAWTSQAAWRRAPADDLWQPVPGWLPGVKSVAFPARTVVTDRESVLATG